METKSDIIYKGTKIRIGDEAKIKRNYLNSCVDILYNEGFEEIAIPIIQYQETFASKVGEENNNMMFNFKDRGDRDLCLAPEYTAVIQKLALDNFKYQKNLKLFYIQECFRGEKPQAGRYRQFTQLGVEIINPTEDYTEYLKTLAWELMFDYTNGRGTLALNSEATRGLDYYKDGKGFEISCEELGAQKQVCGGGSYDGGIGFAIGVDRIMLL